MMSDQNDDMKSEQANLINDLGDSIIKQMSTIPFACGGSIDLRETDSVKFRFGPHGKGSVLSFPITPADMKPLNALLNACSPASFGRGSEEVLDESYRKASKLDIADFLTDFCPYKSRIVDVIAQLLLPSITSERRGVEAELYKLNVYSGPSGKFKPHVDTPRGDGQFGSLVVCLPLSHQGELIM